MTSNEHIQIWTECLNIIRGNVSERDFSIWFSNIHPERLEGSNLYVKVPSREFIEYIEGHFLNILAPALKKVLGDKANLSYIIPNERPSVSEYKGQSLFDNEKGKKNHAPKIDSHLNPVYNMADFIEGECNKVGRSVGIAISENPGTTFNPMFIYGGPGLGKTHLAQAIGLEIQKRFPDKVVLYVSSDNFKNQYVYATDLKNNKLTDFVQFYQMVDVLIVDDVQEFSEKPGTQKAFFNIFNHLHNNKKQLILTADRPPVELKGLEQRLLSRFKWGLSVELEKPDYQTKVRILKSKAAREGVIFGDDVIEYLAKNIDSNIRELEGSLNTISAYAKYNNAEVTVELAEQLIGRLVVRKNTDVSVKAIIDCVCHYFNITIDSMMSKTKKREIVQARQIAMYLSRNMTSCSLQVIGNQIGQRNHATVVHAYNTVVDLIDTDKTFKQYVTDIESSILATC